MLRCVTWLYIQYVYRSGSFGSMKALGPFHLCESRVSVSKYGKWLKRILTGKASVFRSARLLCHWFRRPPSCMCSTVDGKLGE
jgi:hypothetical protein